jgi:DNA-binding ferritin-like protein (Dps family)
MSELKPKVIRVRNKILTAQYSKKSKDKTKEMKKAASTDAATPEFKDIVNHVLGLIKEGSSEKQGIRDAVTAMRCAGNLDDKITIVKAYLDTYTPVSEQFHHHQLQMKSKCPENLKAYVASLEDTDDLDDARLDSTIAFAESFSNYLKSVKDSRSILRGQWFNHALNVNKILKRAKDQKESIEKKRALHVSDQASLTYDDFPPPPKPAAEVPAKEPDDEADTKKVKTAGFFDIFFG